MRSFLLNMWILIITVPGLRDVIIITPVPLDIFYSIFLLIVLVVKYGFKKPNELGYILLLSSLFVLSNEGLYQWVLSLIILLPVLWAPILVHQIGFSSKALMIVLTLISIFSIFYYGDIEQTDWRIPAQLILFTLVIQSSPIQVIIAWLSGFLSLISIPLRRFPLLLGILYFISVKYLGLFDSRLFWNARRFNYIDYLGTGFMHSSSNLNMNYRADSIFDDRFNQVLSVMDFGILDLTIKLGIILTIVYLIFYFKLVTKYASFHFALALFIINITHGYLIHENLIWETFFVIEYFRKYGYKSVRKPVILSPRQDGVLRIKDKQLRYN